MQKINLLPCPFCGCDRVMVSKPVMWQAWCMDCKAIGAANLTKQEAIEAWNTRASGWIPCNERLPENDHYVLVWHKPNDMIYTAVLEYYANGWELDDNLGEYRHASFENAPYWMPLPEAPKRKDDTHDND